ncbi:MAG: GNAT family N-acetyltransferase [Clostridia bacterium]|nr:GNAT family N-acetyltransferase [Clostridia bacterium]
MELIIKHFNELSAHELMEIYKLRVAVFVVEQECAYQEIDNYDDVSYHLWLKDDDGIIAYSRVLPQNSKFEDVSIGRVISARRRCGMGTKIMEAAIGVAKDKFSAKQICLEAQVYAIPFYENVGFKVVSEQFNIDKIPHVKMLLNTER